MKNKIFKILFVIIFSGLSIIIVSFSEICIKNAKEGLIFCSAVLIPSLFPIMICVSVITAILNNIKMPFFDKMGKFFFGLSDKETLIFILSLFSGYPVGAKMINSAYLRGEISEKNARIMQCYSVNAGAGFVISAVGYGVYGSLEIGIILFVSQVLSSITLAIVLRNFTEKENKKSFLGCEKNIGEIFCTAVTDCSKSMMTICGFTVFFFCANGLLYQIKSLDFIAYLLEISWAVKGVKNIYFTAFLLGFSGISVWLQVIAVSKDAGVNIKRFCLSRLFCGMLSGFICFCLIRIFSVVAPAISRNGEITFNITTSNISLTVALFVMIAVLIFSLESKNNGGNLRDDLLQ